MNPREWKREHQIALLIAVVLGLVIGTVVGLYQVDLRNLPYNWRTVSWKFWCEGDWDCIYFHPLYWLAVAARAVLGGAVGAAIIFIRQLLR